MSEPVDLDEMCAAAYGDGCRESYRQVLNDLKAAMMGMERRGEKVTSPETWTAISAIATWIKAEHDRYVAT